MAAASEGRSRRVIDRSVISSHPRAEFGRPRTAREARQRGGTGGARSVARGAGLRREWLMPMVSWPARLSRRASARQACECCDSPIVQPCADARLAPRASQGHLMESGIGATGNDSHGTAGRWQMGRRRRGGVHAERRFSRSETQFRNWVTPDGAPGPTGEGGFKAEPGRYHLYVSLACPWAHRTLIFRKLKKLTEVIGVSVVEPAHALGRAGRSHETGPTISTDRSRSTRSTPRPIPPIPAG